MFLYYGMLCQRCQRHTCSYTQSLFSRPIHLLQRSNTPQTYHHRRRELSSFHIGEKIGTPSYQHSLLALLR